VCVGPAIVMVHVVCLSVSSSSSLVCSHRGPLHCSSMTDTPDTVCPHSSWWALAVFVDLVPPAFRRTTGTMFLRSVWELAKRQVSLAVYSLMDWDSVQHLGNVNESGVATFDDVIHDWRETSLFATSTLQTWSCHLMPSIWCWHLMWKLWSLKASSHMNSSKICKMELCYYWTEAARNPGTLQCFINLLLTLALNRSCFSDSESAVKFTTGNAFPPFLEFTDRKDAGNVD